MCCTNAQVQLKDGRVVYACEYARMIVESLNAPNATHLKRNEAGEWYVAAPRVALVAGGAVERSRK
jgi:hypothetical protein